MPAAPIVTISAGSGDSTVLRRTGEPVHHIFHDYTRTEVMIPMRDGVKLHAVILKPADISTPLPFLLRAHSIRRGRNQSRFLFCAAP